MLTVLFVLVVALITVVGAELVRSSCQRLLQTPVGRPAAPSRVTVAD